MKKNKKQFIEEFQNLLENNPDRFFEIWNERENDRVRAQREFYLIKKSEEYWRYEAAKFEKFWIEERGKSYPQDNRLTRTPVI